MVFFLQLFTFYFCFVVVVVDGSSDEFKGRKILILGASGGFGKESADKVYERGGKIVYSSRSFEKLQKLIADKDSSRAFALKCDVSDIVELKSVINEAASLMGGLDGLVFVPTYMGPDAITLIEDGLANGTAYSGLDSQFNFNVKLPLRAFEYALPHFRNANKGSSYVLISSIAAIRPISFQYR